jgi:acyl carrier protein
LIRNETTFLTFISTELLVSLEEISMSTELRQIRTWSSLNALVLISRINEEIDVIISSVDLASIGSIADLYSFLLAQKNGVS